jgi:DNA-directed RNA polymerase subunit RPC12/RpoP
MAREPHPPAAPYAIRLPLQVGISSLWSFARCAATLVPSIGAIVFGVTVLFAQDKETRAMFVLGLIGLLLLGFALMHLWIGVRDRPSDVLLGPAGLAIEGGPHAGLRVAWSELYLDGCKLEEDTVTRITIGGILRSIATRDDEMGFSEVPVLRLHLVLMAGELVTAAEAERPLEMESLRALLDSIRSGHWAGGESSAEIVARERERQDRIGARVLRCAQCGAPVQPEDAPAVACGHCGAEVAMPSELQERIRAAREILRTGPVSEELVLELLDQPGAARTSYAMLLSGVPMMLAWPAALVIAVARGTFDHVAALRAATRERAAVELCALAVFALSTVLALFFLMRRRLADRQALRLLTLELGARAPARPGAPHRCRTCEAPLPATPNKVLVRCIYCDADNILGLDLRRQAAHVAEQSRGLEQALAQRRKERWLWGGASALALLLLMTGGGALALDLGMDPATKPAPADKVRPPVKRR